MPVTKTAKRALRVSKRKQEQNKKTMTQVEIAVRQANRSKKAEDVQKATSLIDRAAKKNIIHDNKAARMKSRLSKLAKPVAPKTKKSATKKKTTSKAKSKSKSKK